jgi:hypothetical protein
MTSPRSDLEQTMSNKTDEELYDILGAHSEDYIADAIEVAREEFERRKLDASGLTCARTTAATARQEKQLINQRRVWLRGIVGQEDAASLFKVVTTFNLWIVGTRFLMLGIGWLSERIGISGIGSTVAGLFGVVGGLLNSLCGMVVGSVPEDNLLAMSRADWGFSTNPLLLPIWGNLILLVTFFALRLLVRRWTVPALGAAIGVFLISYFTFARLNIPGGVTFTAVSILVSRLVCILICGYYIWAIRKTHHQEV